MGHENLGPSPDLDVVGAYPPEQSMDMMGGKPSELPRADESNARVPLLESDPVFVKDWPWVRIWKIAAEGG